MSIDAAVGPTTVSVKVRSRWNDCDRYGHVNNAAPPVPPEVTVGVDISVLVGRIRPAPERRSAIFFAASRRPDES